MKIAFKNYKDGRYIVILNEQGKRVQWRKQRGSGIRSKQEATHILKTTNSLYENRIRLQGKQKTKTLSVKGKNFKRFSMIGRNTASVITQKPLKTQENYQYIAYLTIKGKTFTGYSDIQGTTKQAFLRARALAINDGIIGYDWVFDRATMTIMSPRGQKVQFKLDIQVQTFVKIQAV